MKRRLFGSVGLFMLAILSASMAFGQDQTLRSVAGDKWVITAKAGGVNHVEGAVGIVRQTGKSGILLKSDTIAVGDRVSTGANGRAEILLNPGSYLRVAENTAFEFKTTQLEDLQVVVHKGSVILEIYATNDFKVSVNTPKEEYGLIETGVYRIDVAADGQARLEVWKGKAEVGDSVLKGGRAAVTTDGQVAVAKFDRDDRDDFETWSRLRAKELAKSTNDLKDRTLRTSLMRTFLGGRWNTYDSFGLWVMNPRTGRYCFLPFGYGWSSPYGFGFGADIWWYGLPRTIFYPPTGGGTGGVPVGGTGGGTRGRRPPPDREPIERGPVNKTPPFAAVQGGRSTGRDFGGGFDPGSGSRGRDGGFTPGPVFDPGPRMPAPKIDPIGLPGPSRDMPPVKGKDN